MRNIGLLLLGLVGLALLWPSKIRAALGVVGLIAVMAAIGFLAVVVLNLPSRP